MKIDQILFDRKQWLIMYTVTGQLATPADRTNYIVLVTFCDETHSQSLLSSLL